MSIDINRTLLLEGWRGPRSDSSVPKSPLLRFISVDERSTSTDSHPGLAGRLPAAAKSASVLGKEVQACGYRIDVERADPANMHVCVPTITLKGDSYRLRGKPKAEA